MDNYTKGVLTVIAVCLVAITFQLTDTKPISNAQAELGMADYSMVDNRLFGISNELHAIANAIDRKKCN